MIGNQLHSFGQLANPSISPYLRFYPFAEGGVLHWRHSHRIWVLNTPAAYLWCLLAEGSSREELPLQLVNRFAIDHATAARDVALTLSAFTEAGLFENEPIPRRQEDENSLAAGSPPGRSLVEPAAWLVEMVVQTPNQVVAFRCQDLSLGAEFTTLFAHLKGRSTLAPITRLAVLADARSAGRWEIHLNGRLFIDGLARDEVLPHLFTLIFVKGSEALQSFLLFHAAVVGGREQALILPAEAGSGKSTLVAALAARGHRFFSDELAAVDPTTLKLLPIAMPMTIKSGSTAILERYYPGLSAKPVHQRADGQKVRYLAPPTAALSNLNGGGAVSEAIIFPRYQAGVDTRLTALDKVSALERLVHTGSSDRELLAADVEALIDLVEGKPCYALEYADLDEVVALLEGTFACLGSVRPSG